MRLPDFMTVYSGADGRVNSTVIVGERGAVVIDTHVTLEDGKAIRNLADEMSGEKPIAAVLLTHEHFDHIAGNQFFDCPIISTVQAREAMLEMGTEGRPEGYVLTPPTVTFSHETTLYLGNMSVRLWHEGGHCPGQCSIYIPEHGILLTGDNVFHGTTPYVAPADVPQWIEVLTRLHSMDPQIVVPGHGAPGDKSILVKQRDWLEAFLDLTQKSAKAGLTVDDATDKVMISLKADPGRRLVIMAGVSRIYKSMGL